MRAPLLPLTLAWAACATAQPAVTGVALEFAGKNRPIGAIDVTLRNQAAQPVLAARLAAVCPAVRPLQDIVRVHLRFAEQGSPLLSGKARTLDLPLLCAKGAPEQVRLAAVYYADGSFEGDPAALADYVAALQAEVAAYQAWLPHFQALRQSPDFGAAAVRLAEDLHMAVFKAGRTDKRTLKSLADTAARLADGRLSLWQPVLAKLEQRWTRLQPFLAAVPAPVP